MILVNALTGCLNPRYAPTKAKGVNTQNQRENSVKNVVNGIAAELLLAQRTRFRMKKMPKITLKLKFQ